QETLKKAFQYKDLEDLRELLKKSFNDKQFNQGLADAVKLVRARLETNVGSTAAPVAGGMPPPGLHQGKDYARFLSDAQVQKANEDLRDLQQDLKADMIVETFKTVPEDKVKDAKTLSTREGRERFFENWAHERMREAQRKDGGRFDGVYL